jgi:hypothetical protein
MPACLDVTPLVVEKEASIAATDFPCLRCLQSPDADGGCANEIADCTNDPRCEPIYECIVALACVDLPTIDDKLQCGLPCAQEAGVSTTEDPIVAKLLAWVRCGETGCADPCNLRDAGIAPDGV